LNYRPAEIGGTLLDVLSLEDRATLVANVTKGVHECPFSGSECKKNGRVCTIINHDDVNEFFTPTLVAVCPSRFHQLGVVHAALSKTVLQGSNLHEMEYRAEVPLHDDDEKKNSARLDFLYCTKTDDEYQLFVGAEYQSCYFQGNKMHIEINHIIETGDLTPQIKGRRPDVKSSVKRLYFQVEQKLRWLKQLRPNNKLMLVVDSHFIDEFDVPDESLPWEESEIQLVVVGYDHCNPIAGSARLFVAEQRSVSLAGFKRAALGGELSHAAFFNYLNKNPPIEDTFFGSATV
jgi:hypothetical protein